MSNLAHLSLSKSGLVFDSCSGDSYQINASANLIIQLFLAEKSPENIAEILAQKFSLKYEQALLDVLDFKTQLSIMGLTK